MGQENKVYLKGKIRERKRAQKNADLKRKKVQEHIKQNNGQNPKKKRRLRILKTIAILAAAGFIAVASTGCATEPPKHVTTIEQVLEDGKTLEDLGIDESVLGDFDKINEIIAKQKITKEDVAEAYNSILGAIKEKISNALGLEGGKDLEIWERYIKDDPFDSSTWHYEQRVEVGDEIYSYNGEDNPKNTVSKEIANAIKNIANFGTYKDYVMEFNNSELDKGKVCEKVQNYVDAADSFVSQGVVYVDGKLLTEGEWESSQITQEELESLYTFPNLDDEEK